MPDTVWIFICLRSHRHTESFQGSLLIYGELGKFCVSDTDFSRTRKLPFEKIALLIARLCKKTLSVELDTFFEELGCLTNCSVSAFVQQRIKLEPVFFILLPLLQLQVIRQCNGEASDTQTFKSHF